jgi:hypothetical protein
MLNELFNEKLELLFSINHGLQPVVFDPGVTGL